MFLSITPEGEPSNVGNVKRSDPGVVGVPGVSHGYLLEIAGMRAIGSTGPLGPTAHSRCIKMNLAI